MDDKEYITAPYLTEQLTAKANLTDVYTKTEIDGKNFATEGWVDEQLVAKANLTDVYTKIEIDGKNLAPKDWVATELLAYAKVGEVYTKDEVDEAIDNVDVDLTGYATEDWVKEQNYLTEHQSLEGYATESYVDDAVETKVDSSEIWTGTQDEWDALSVEQQNSYTIAMIEIEL